MIALIAALSLMVEPADRWSTASISPVITNGQLGACALNFKAVQSDTLYFSGRPVGIDGSFNVYHFGHARMGAMLKGTILDGQKLNRPDTLYLIDGYKTNIADLIENNPNTDAGYMLSGFELGLSTLETYLNSLERNQLIVGAQMQQGASAIPFQIDLTDDQVLEWLDCTTQLLNDAQAAIDNE